MQYKAAPINERAVFGGTYCPPKSSNEILHKANNAEYSEGPWSS